MKFQECCLPYAQSLIGKTVCEKNRKVSKEYEKIEQICCILIFQKRKSGVLLSNRNCRFRSFTFSVLCNFPRTLSHRKVFSFQLKKATLKQPTLKNLPGGESGTRTRDLRFRKPQLYPLSYFPAVSALVPGSGFEPPTKGL